MCVNCMLLVHTLVWWEVKTTNLELPSTLLYHRVSMFDCVRVQQYAHTIYISHTPSISTTNQPNCN